MDITLTNLNFTLKPYSYFIGEIFRYTSYIHIIFILSRPDSPWRNHKKKVWSPTVYLVRGSGKTRIQIDNIPTLVVYIARISIYRQVMSVIAIPCILQSLPDFLTKDKSYTFIN